MFKALFFCFTIHWAEYSQALQITIKQEGRGIWQGQIQQFLCKIQVNSVQTYGQFSWPTSVSISVLVCLHPGWSTHPCQIVFHVTDTTTSYKSCLNEGRACEAFIVSVDWPAVNFEKKKVVLSLKRPEYVWKGCFAMKPLIRTKNPSGPMCFSAYVQNILMFLSGLEIVRV